jgi:hypothetical protein
MDVCRSPFKPDQTRKIARAIQSNFPAASGEWSCLIVGGNPAAVVKHLESANVAICSVGKPPAKTKRKNLKNSL